MYNETCIYTVHHPISVGVGLILLIPLRDNIYLETVPLAEMIIRLQ